MNADIDKTASVTLVTQSGKEKKFIPMEDSTPDGLIQYLKDTFSHNDGVTVKGAYWDEIAVIKAIERWFDDRDKEIRPKLFD